MNLSLGQINCVAFAMMIKIVYYDSQKTSFGHGRRIRNQIKKDKSSGVKQTKDKEKKKNRKKIYGTLGTFFTLGLTWITGFFYMGQSKQPFISQCATKCWCWRTNVFIIWLQLQQERFFDFFCCHYLFHFVVMFTMSCKLL